MSRRHESVLDDPDVSAALAKLHHKFVVVPADKASNNIVFVCKTHFINFLMEDWYEYNNRDPTYKLTTLSKEELLQNHNSVVVSFDQNLSLSDEDLDLPKLLNS